MFTLFTPSSSLSATAAHLFAPYARPRLYHGRESTEQVLCQSSSFYGFVGTSLNVGSQQFELASSGAWTRNSSTSRALVSTHAQAGHWVGQFWARALLALIAEMLRGFCTCTNRSSCWAAFRSAIRLLQTTRRLTKWANPFDSFDQLFGLQGEY